MTIKAPEKIDILLTENGYKKNGYDYWRKYGVTDGENEWYNEVYISKTIKGYEIYFPEDEKRNKVYKTEKGLINFLNRNGELF